MENITDIIKQQNGYRLRTLGCKDCDFFEEDPSTDNFGPGDRCMRNPDVTFRTDPHACCNKLKEKCSGS